MIKSDRGDDENSVGMIWFIKSKDVRAKYFDEEGAFTELFSTKFEKVNKAFVCYAVRRRAAGGQSGGDAGRADHGRR